MVYDTGPPGEYCSKVVSDLVPNHRIDLLVLSHSDADHIAGAETILAGNVVEHWR
jgi:glyoxylase-like metal-dependent hydrolase (beta-lactamase superfamily II)